MSPVPPGIPVVGLPRPGGGWRSTESVLDLQGPYGSHHSATSISNPSGSFGSPGSPFSACNPFATDPPIIVDDQGYDYGWLTLDPSRAMDPSADAVQRWIDRLCAPRPGPVSRRTAVPLPAGAPGVTLLHV
jgi:hypothetical protein